MSALPTPKIIDLDDPLMPRRQQPVTAATAPRHTVERRPARKPAAEKPAPAPTSDATSQSLADEPLVAVFARLPESLSDRLSEGLRALNVGRRRRGRVSQQDLLGALVDHYVTPEDPAALLELVDAYRQRIRR